MAVADDNLIASDPTEHFFQGPGGRLFLRGVRPSSAAIARLVIVHGYGDHSGRFSHFMRWMAGRGIACHAADLRGQGRSDGRKGYVARWEHYLDDLAAILSQTSAGEGPHVPLFVLGHSHGGLVVAAAGERGVLERAGVRGVVLTSPYLRSKMRVPRAKIVLGRAVGLFFPWLPVATGLQNEWMSSDPDMVEDTRVDPLCTRVATPRWYTGQLRAQGEVMKRAGDFRLPLFVLGAGADRVADTSAAEEFVSRAGSADKTFRSYPGLLHELLRE
ncbi:MAG TPA: lysophospholipase, partial [Tepidisphaeraceae bacterium]|nr:lysophospholipase [Tepidisphaeraceae bacterium]